MKEETAASGRFTFDLQIPETDIIVQWDPLKIEQAERNLLSNAVQYSKPEGGKITLSARQANENIVVGVSDEGIGVPPESVESMFDLFTRGANTEQRQVKHFGIGLKLCKDIVSQHRGRIWVESKLNLGTTIFLLLPIDPKAHAPLSATAG
jgi:two-component system sensor histidine kinase VicK